MDFGPDGYLYIATGDGGSGGDPEENAQDVTSRLGKILRVDPLDPDGPGPRKFTLPPDNPYFGGIDGNDWVWSYGLRNPWRVSFDRLNGELWIGDVGQGDYEEVDHRTGSGPGRGTNFGWDRCEGDHPFEGSADKCGPPPNTTERPVAEYVNGSDCSVTGGYVYRGTRQPSLVGSYFFGDFCSGKMWAIPTDFDLAQGDILPAPFDTAHNISSFGEDAAGELYVVDLNGPILRVVED